MNTENLVLAIFIVGNISIIYLLSANFDLKDKVKSLIKAFDNNAKVLDYQYKDLEIKASAIETHSDTLTFLLNAIEEQSKELEVLKEVLNMSEVSNTNDKV